MRALEKSETNISTKVNNYQNKNAEHCFILNNLSHYETLVITAGGGGRKKKTPNPTDFSIQLSTCIKVFLENTACWNIFFPS